MTPEERLTRIENAIQALTGVQARREMQLETHTAAIRDLIVLNRSFVESLQESRKTTAAEMKELRERTATDMRELREALRTLTRNVDKLARGRGSNGRRN